MQPVTNPFPDFDSAVDALFAELQPEIDKVIAELEPEPSLKEWLRSACNESTPDHRQ